jgi:hypothetical protein
MGHMAGRPEQKQPQATDAERETPSARAALPPPVATPRSRTSASLVLRLVSFVADRPFMALAAIFTGLLALHLAILNLAGTMSGVFAGEVLFLLDPVAAADLLLLGLIAYCMVLPTLLARASLAAYSDTAGALSATDQEYDATLAALAEPGIIVRLVFGGFWAAVMTPVFGNLVSAGAAAPQAATWLIMLWLYIRLALVFGMLGSSLAHVALLQYRLSGALERHLRVDLFDASALAPLARHMRQSILYLSVPLLLMGPVLSRPDAATASATLMGFGILVVLVAGFGGMWGARMAIRTTKQLVQGELNAYSREIWRRAYSNGRIVEAVALPAMAGMLTIRNQIARMANWPGGWPNVLRCLLIALLPAVSWFGPQAIQILLEPFL